MTTPLLSLALALSNIFRAFTAHLSLSRCIYIYSRSLSLSLTYFEHLQHISLSLAVYVYVYILQPMTTHHTLLSLPLPLSLTYFKHLKRTSLSLSALQALYKYPHPSSRSLSLSLTYFEHLQHISLSLCTPRTCKSPHPSSRSLSLPLAVSNISLQRRSRLRTRSLGMRRPSQNTANEALTCARLLPALPNATTSRRLTPMDRAGILLRKSVKFFDLRTKLSKF